MEKRVHIAIKGAVQGVGFRPFIYRIAIELGLKGFVRNSSIGVFIEAEGEKRLLDLFILKIEKEKPYLSYITSFEYSFLDVIGFTSFEIRESEKEDDISAIILPDIASCPDCLSEMFDPSNRRYLYPFINCTNCGPRFSIIESLPYDRPNTSMKNFIMCDECRQEYTNPNDRRYHAQPIACPKCGPHIELFDNFGKLICKNHDAISETCEHVLSGKIVAVKGIGGFQLIANACDDDIVLRLRDKKQREEKPFAIMLPDLDSIKSICQVSPIEERLLLSAESPIVLLKKRSKMEKGESGISEIVATGNPYLGVMLPYTPQHHLLMQVLKIPVIATSGNISEEPMCIDNPEALERLNNIADYFLVHDRPIVRHVDDSIVRIINGREMVLRRARGYAPLPIIIDEDYKDNPKNHTLIAFGGHLKNTIALQVQNNIFISQHIGDLETGESNNAFRKVIKDFKKLYNAEPWQVACDLHPDYSSTKYAVILNLKIHFIQHHIAHIASCRAENRMHGTALGVAWDGTGLGFDGTIWGGEFFISNDNSIKHVAQLRQFPLPGGDNAVREPRRSALGIMYEIYGDSIFENTFPGLLKEFDSKELIILRNMLNNKINCPLTSSIGRLFDAISSITGVAQRSNYEGQAAMNLEFASDEKESGTYHFSLTKQKIVVIDWKQIIEEVLNDVSNKIPTSVISARFHNTLVEIIFAVVNYFSLKKVILSGGCFQNAILTEKSIKKLEENEIKVYWHQRVPPNDGGIALGQIAAVHYGY
ncbi:MAG: carbamoyltransferase HypF [bacterium]